MRTTLNIDDELLKAAKIAAIREGRTLTALVEEALRDKVAPAPSREWEIPAHIDRNDHEAVAEFIAYMESKRDLRPLLGPPKTSKAELFPGIDFTSVSELIEHLEGPFARP